jgi:hypothetical protein
VSFKGINDDEPLPMGISMLKKRMKTALYVEILLDIWRMVETDMRARVYEINGVQADIEHTTDRISRPLI